jgi:hypothetical protein
MTRLVEEGCGTRNPVADSHDLVAYWMMWMNRRAGTELRELARGGIFRTVVVDPADAVDGAVDGAINRFINVYRHTTASYELAENDRGHQLMASAPDTESSGPVRYAQITSPIRRFVDLVNMEILRTTRTHPNELIARIVRTPESIVDLNRKMKQLRRAQNDATLLDYGLAHSGEIITAVVIESDDTAPPNRPSNHPIYRYTVFADKIEKLFRVETVAPLALYERYSFKIVHFQNAPTIGMKVRLQLV